jgi:hypothetical protein
MSRTYLTLHPSEQTGTAAAAQIFAAYVLSGRVPEGSEREWLARSVREAIEIAKLTDELVKSEGEMG